MAVNRTPQEHVETVGSSIDDTLTPTSHDANAIDLKTTIDHLASQVADITGKVAWETAPDASIATIWGKTFLDEKLILRWVPLLTDITVPNAQNYKILSVAGSELPTAKVKAIGSTTKGLVTKQATTFGASNLDEITGKSALFPKNILRVWDGTTGDAIESSGRQVYALLQHEATATDGTDFTDTTPQRAQVSFVRPNSTYDDLEACPVADIENKVVNMAYVNRTDMDTATEQDFLDDVEHIDLGIAGAATTLNNAIDNQGATPATQTTDIFVRIDDDAEWDFATSDGARNILRVAPAAAGDVLEANADTVDINVGASGVVDIDNGVTVDSGGTPLNLGVTPGQIDAGAAALTVTSSGAAVTVDGVGLTLDGNAGNVVMDGAVLDADFTAKNGHVIQSVTDAATSDLLVASRNAGAGIGTLTLEADDEVYYTDGEETSPLPFTDATAGAISATGAGSHASIAAAIQSAYENGGVDLSFKSFTMGSAYAKDANVPAASLDLTAFSIDMGGTPTAFGFLQGRLLEGASAIDTADYYPGTTPASGDVKFSFPGGVKIGWKLFTIGLKQ